MRDIDEEVKGDSDPNDDTDEEAECVNTDLGALADFLGPPTGNRVIGRSEDSRR